MHHHDVLLLIVAIFGVVFFIAAAMKFTFGPGPNQQPRFTPDWLALSLLCWFLLVAALPVFYSF